jgi:hypothetical protein
MWAAYQGDALSVDLLIRHGASIVATDNAGMTPLHWAAVKGSKACIQYLAAAGADLGAKEEQGKTPQDMAEELKGLAPFTRALEGAGTAQGIMTEVSIPRDVADVAQYRHYRFRSTDDHSWYHLYHFYTPWLPQLSLCILGILVNAVCHHSPTSASTRGEQDFCFAILRRHHSRKYDLCCWLLGVQIDNWYVASRPC